MELLPESITSNQGFATLMKMLHDLNKYTPQLHVGGSSGKQGHRRHWGGHGVFYPNFDVRELDDAFELYGELAGVQKKDIVIEFSDPQVLVVRGRIERHYNTAKPVLQPPADGPASSAEAGQCKQNIPVTKERISGPGSDAAEYDGGKYWASERSIGEFSRIFTFAERVQQDGVTATLDGGILSIRLLKAAKHEKGGQRIEIV